jgi:hypothetical protein
LDRNEETREKKKIWRKKIEERGDLRPQKQDKRKNE